jgi:hypothetical protein
VTGKAVGKVQAFGFAAAQNSVMVGRVFIQTGAAFR